MQWSVVDGIGGEIEQVHLTILSGQSQYSQQNVCLKIVPAGIKKLKPSTYQKGAKGDWNFQISDLVKNPDGTDI